MKKRISALLALVLAAALCAGCGEKDETPSGIYYDITGIDPSEIVMTVDGNEIPAELYCYWTSYNCSSLEYQISMSNAYYGLYGEFLDEDGAVLWDAAFTDEQTLGDYAREQTENTIQFYAAIENMAKENGVALTEEDKADIAANRAAAVEELGGDEAFQAYLAKMGISQESFDRLFAASYLYDGLKELVLQEGSPLYLSSEDYNLYASYADHILLSTQDAETGAALSDEEIAAKYATAQDLLARLQAAEDVEALFTQLADEYSEDPGRAAYPNGYFVEPDSSFVAEFLDAAFALEPGQISGIVESSYGYHILLRRDVREYLEENPDKEDELVDEHLTSLLSLMMEEASVERSEKLDAIDPGAFYVSYTAALDALEAEEDSDSGSTDTAGGEDSSDGTGDTDTGNDAGGQ